MKAFISQPFNGYTKEQIENIRKAAIKQIPDTFTILNNTVEDDYETNPVRGLGKSIKILSEADKVFFVYVDNQPLSRGCRVEKFICDIYKIPYELMFVKV